MIVKLLTEQHLEFLSLKGGSRGSSESTHVKMPHCWKFHALAQICTIGSKMHDNRTIPFFIEMVNIGRCIITGKGSIEYDIYLYKTPIFWISLFFLLYNLNRQ